MKFFPPTSSQAFTALLLGSGELGREVAIELMRYGIKVVAADRYSNAPAQLISNEAKVLNMNDGEELRKLIDEVQPDVVIPEIEAIATEVLVEVEKNGLKSGKKTRITPSAKAVNLTMNREGIRRLAAEELRIKTSNYLFANSHDELKEAAEKLGFPVVIKPIQSSSGKGQSVAKNANEIEKSWEIAQSGARGKTGEVVRVICESFVDFDYEITLLTVRGKNGVVFLDPIGHKQVDGDYRVSWQQASEFLDGAQVGDARAEINSLSNVGDARAEINSLSNVGDARTSLGNAQVGGAQPNEKTASLMTKDGLLKAQKIADSVTAALVSETSTGWGVFGVELFIKRTKNGEEVIFSEVSPRPHDTGMVTLISQDQSEFALHARALLGLPVEKPQRIPSHNSNAVSVAVLAHGKGTPSIEAVENALNSIPGAKTDLKIFGKPEVDGERRVAVFLSLSDKMEIEKLKAESEKAVEKLVIEVN